MSVTEPWDSFQKLCPVVSSRQILKAGKHMFKIIIKERQTAEFLASDGLIKVFMHLPTKTDQKRETKAHWNVLSSSNDDPPCQTFKNQNTGAKREYVFSLPPGTT